MRLLPMLNAGNLVKKKRPLPRTCYLVRKALTQSAGASSAIRKVVYFCEKHQKLDCKILKISAKTESFGPKLKISFDVFSIILRI